MSPVGRSGYTGPAHIGPTGTPGATGATGPAAGTVAAPSSIDAPWSRVGDGLHSHESFAFAKSLGVDAVHVTSGLHSTHPTALDAVVMLLAIYALLEAGRTAIQHVINLLLRLRLA